MDFYKSFHDLVGEVAITNRLLLERCEDKEMIDLLTRQRDAVLKALDTYFSIMKEKREEL